MSRKKPPDDKLGRSGPPAKRKASLNVAWETPECPATIEDEDRWVDVWALGGPTGVYHPVADFGLVRRYCEMCERRAMMLAQLTAEGWTVPGSQGQEVQHPLARLLSDVEGKLVAIEDRLGLNPQARHTIQIGHAKTMSALEEWLAADD